MAPADAGVTHLLDFPSRAYYLSLKRMIFSGTTSKMLTVTLPSYSFLMAVAMTFLPFILKFLFLILHTKQTGMVFLFLTWWGPQGLGSVSLLGVLHYMLRPRKISGGYQRG
jgi:hypothetical protein